MPHTSSDKTLLKTEVVKTRRDNVVQHSYRMIYCFQVKKKLASTAL